MPTSLPNFEDLSAPMVNAANQVIDDAQVMGIMEILPGGEIKLANESVLRSMIYEVWMQSREHVAAQG